MGRLIDDDEAMNAIDNRIRQIGYEDFILMLSIRRAVREVKPVDAVPVVRCKDCKYWRDTDHTCRGHSLVSPMTADDFCSYGKKDDDHEKAD